MGGVDDPAVEEAPDAQSAPQRHRARRAVIAVSAVVVVIVAAGLWFTFGGERASESSDEEARQRLGSVVAPTSTAEGAAPLTSGPAPGLYHYTGSGTEKTSFPPLTEEQGPSMPATVTVEPDGCWVLQIDYNTHHWQSWTYCTADGELHQTKGGSYAKRDFGGLAVEDTSEAICDPPAFILSATDQPGVSRTRSCTGSGSAIPTPTTGTGTTAVVGTETIDIGGESVLTTHIRYELTYSGGQNGPETGDYWLDSNTGMPVRNERHLTVGTDTPFGQITYTEDADFTLQSLTPS